MQTFRIKKGRAQQRNPDRRWRKEAGDLEALQHGEQVVWRWLRRDHIGAAHVNRRAQENI